MRSVKGRIRLGDEWGKMGNGNILGIYEGKRNERGRRKKRSRNGRGRRIKEIKEEEEGKEEGMEEEE